MKVNAALILLCGLAGSLLGQEYVLIGWNDLGMHCANKDFSNLAILPPYNNVTAELIRKGDAGRAPQLVTSGFTVTYAIPGNTYSVGKTNFWSYEDKLFGVSLLDHIGLTGNGLAGTMSVTGDHYEVSGIPITPYTDADLAKESPYQLALLKAFDAANTLLATTQCVLPVSNEIGCVSSGCHASESALLGSHENEGGFDANARPILCAKCHASNALGMPGRSGLPSLSLALHDKHKDRTNDCYKCHPGATTRCLRAVMYSKGMTSQSCHGSLRNVASTIKTGRRPWLDEPKCGASSCHGDQHAEESGKLFRQSRGHGGLYCSTCHGSPHAIVPTIEPNDNVQNIALQGYPGVLRDCRVCHGVQPAGAGPHGVITGIPQAKDTGTPARFLLQPAYPNPFNGQTRILFDLPRSSRVTVRIWDIQGRLVSTLCDGEFSAGRHQLHWDGADGSGRALPSGIYFCSLMAQEQNHIQRLALIK